MTSDSDRRVDFYRRPGVLFAFLVVACFALAIGYSWRASVQRAALFQDESLPEIGSLSDLDVTIDQPEEEVASEDAQLLSVTEVPNEVADGRGIEEAVTPDVVSDRLSAATVAVNELRVPEHAIFIRHTGLDASYGIMSALRLTASGEDRRATPLRCDRLHFVNRRGVCLATDRFYTTHSIMVFDESFEPLHTLPLNGIPSRTRLSRDGRRAAVTVFVSGHSYAEAGFSTETSIIDTNTGERVVNNLEEFELFQGATRIRAADLNYWGVTFGQESDHFYATLGTAGSVYLVEGRVSDRRIYVLREGVECPALSPDETRIAFKKRIFTDTEFMWRLHVLDLASSVETPLAEVRHVDDQVEWLNNQEILYAMPDESAPTARVTDIWKVLADGSGNPELLLKEAFSPAVLSREDRAR